MSPAADHPDGLLLKVRVQPRSSRTMIAGLHGDALKLKITAPPVEGAANRMCLDYLAEVLAVPKSRLELTAGHKGRLKLILVRCDASEKPGLKRLLAELAAA